MRVKLPLLVGGWCAALLAATPVTSQAPAPAAHLPVIDELVEANHILANEGVVDGYGHVSVRSPTNLSLPVREPRDHEPGCLT